MNDCERLLICIYIHIGFRGFGWGRMAGCREHCYDAFCNDAAYLASYGGNYAANYVVLSV